jgi:hypothetical protein
MAPRDTGVKDKQTEASRETTGEARPIERANGKGEMIG